MSLFGPATLLLPKEAEMNTWAVIACDQFTSQPDYWAEAEKLAEGKRSALNLILPEARLSGDDSAAITCINAAMQEYLEAGVFQSYDNAYIYVERTLLDGSVRRGIVGALDLEGYDCRADATAPARATEQTVPARIPARVAIRRNAPLELPHVLLLCDDAQDLILGTAERLKSQLPLLYDFDLMLGGGHIRGWLLQGAAAEAVTAAEATYCAVVEARYAQRAADAGIQPVLYAAGDGNHSIASAKALYEELKAAHPGENLSAHPARWALVELDNIHDDAQKFEPIHRLVTDTDVKNLLAAAEEAIGGEGAEIRWFAGGETGSLRVDTADGRLPIAVLQSFLDGYLACHAGSIDYIHGDDAVQQLATGENSIGFLLPDIGKEDFFTGIAAGGVLPRKTFSMGHAKEKRYYLEARAIR